MLFDEKTADRLLNSPDNLLKKVSGLVRLTPEQRCTELLPDGRRVKYQNNEFTTAERSLGAALSHLDTGDNIAKLLGASRQQVVNWKSGRLQHNNQNPNGNSDLRPELVNATRVKLGAIRDVAMDKLLKTLGVINDDDLKALHPKDASIVAGNLARVVEKTLPKEEAPIGAQVVMYMPTQMNIEEYTVVEG
jgi:hypothetical protein